MRCSSLCLVAVSLVAGCQLADESPPAPLAPSAAPSAPASMSPTELTRLAEEMEARAAMLEATLRVVEGRRP